MSKYVSNFTVAGVDEPVYVKDSEARNSVSQLETSVNSQIENLSQAISGYNHVLKKRIKDCGDFIIAHAGNAGDAPENSKIGIARACNYLFDGIEIDTQISRDNVPIIAHNNDLSTFTNMSGSISDLDYSAFSSAVITVPPYNSAYSTAEKTIPTVEDGINIIRQHKNIIPMIDIKDSYDTLAKMEALLQVCEKTGMKYETIYVCDSHEKALLLKQADPYIAIMSVINTFSDAEISFAVDNELFGISCNYGGASRAYVDSAKNNGLVVSLWTLYDSASQSSLTAIRNYMPDMILVQSPNWYCSGVNYNVYPHMIYAYEKLGENYMFSKYEADMVKAGKFTCRTTYESDIPFPKNANAGVNNRAMLLRKITCAKDDVFPLAGSSALDNIQYSFVECDAEGNKLAESGWTQSSYTVANANTAFVYVVARLNDNSAMSMIDLENINHYATF